MTDSNSTALRGALARAIKSHVDDNGLNGVSAAKLAGIANSRMSTILRGQVEKVSADALVDILGAFGYRLGSVIGSTEGHEFTLTLDDAAKGLPEIEAPVQLTAQEKAIIEEPIHSDSSEYEDESNQELGIDPDADRVVAYE